MILEHKPEVGSEHHCPPPKKSQGGMRKLSCCERKELGLLVKHGSQSLKHIAQTFTSGLGGTREGRAIRAAAQDLGQGHPMP